MRSVCSIAAILLMSISGAFGQSVYGHYAPGAVGQMKSAVLPPPGLPGGLSGGREKAG